MKYLLNFCFGSSMSLIIINNIGFAIVNSNNVEIFKAFISMFGGVLSTVIVWYLNVLYNKKRNLKSVNNYKPYIKKTDLKRVLKRNKAGSNQDISQ